MDVSQFVADNFNERTWSAVLIAGLVIVAIAYFWLALRAVQASKWWRVGYLPPFALLYLLSFSRRVIAPLILLLLGAAVFAAPFVMTHSIQPWLAERPRERPVDNEIHLTLTGIPNYDYSSLKGRHDIAVLQLANPEVTDETVALLAGMENLHELDLSHTAVTDAGLATLKTLTKLKTLRLQGAKNITDAGFNQNLFHSLDLREIDVRDTAVKPETVTQWKNAKEGRKAPKMTRPPPPQP